MMRSLFSGVAGLKTHQTRMDVIGNNIANVNTVAYKSASMTFQELMYQTTQSASGANAETGRGGVNARQIGLGVTTGAINTNITTSGASQTTGNPFDIQISGDSFFIVSDGANNFFTRAGAFYVDGAGNLAMTSNGFTVMGWQPSTTDPTTIQKDNVSPLKIMSAENTNSAPAATTEAYIAGIVDKNSDNLSSDKGQIVNISFYDNLGYSYIAKYAVFNYYDVIDDSVSPARGMQVELPEGIYRIELTDIQDSEGKSIAGENSLDEYATIAEGGSFVYTDTSVSPSKDITVNVGKNTAFLRYNTSTGDYMGFASTPGDALTVDNPKAKMVMDMKKENFASVNIALDTSTMYDNNGTSTIAGRAGDYDGNFAGRKMGTMSGVSIQTDGKIYATYDNGTTKLLGQIAVASFPNPSGLEKVGDNLYQTTQNSGEFDGIGQDVTADGSGKMSTGVLEMSNVDLSSEFTEMITTQRGFQANSRIITVSDSMLEELTNLKR